MGLLDNLFKPKPEADAEKAVESSGNPEPGEQHTPSAQAAGATAAKASPFLAPKIYVPRASVQIVPPSRSQLSGERKLEPIPNAPVFSQEVVLTLGDVLPRIPTHFLRAGMHDTQRELRFPAAGLAADIARGRASVFLADIVAQCPDIFLPESGEFDDTQIRLPLQKLVEQIGLAPATAYSAPVADRSRPIAAQLATEDRVVGERVTERLAAEIFAPTPVLAPASAPPEEGQIHLSLAVILKRCPKEIIIQTLPPIADSVRVSFPFAPIERQLATGQVEVSSLRFIAALPLGLMKCFEAKAGVKVPLPLEEIFQNLPNQTVPPSAAGKSDASTREPEIPVETSHDIAFQNAKLAESILLEPMPEPTNGMPGNATDEIQRIELPAETPVENVIVNGNFTAEPAIEPPAPPPPELIEPEFHTSPVAALAAEPAAENIVEPAKIESRAEPEPPPEEAAIEESKLEPKWDEPKVDEPALEPFRFEEATVPPEPVEEIVASTPPTAPEPVALHMAPPDFRRFSPSLPPPVLLKPDASFTEPPFARNVPPQPPVSVDIPAEAPVVPEPEAFQTEQAFNPSPESIEPAPTPPPESVSHRPSAEPPPIEPEPVVTMAEPAVPDAPTMNVRIAPPQFRPVVVLPPPVIASAAESAPPVAQPTPPVPQPAFSAPPVNQEPEPVAEASHLGDSQVAVHSPVAPEPPAPVEIPEPMIERENDPAPAPASAIPAIPAEPSAPFMLDGNVPALFASDSPLALPRVGQLLAALPGIQGCVLTSRGENARGGELPDGLDARAVRELSQRMRGALSDCAEAFNPGQVQHITLHAERYSLTLFTRGEACVCAVHRARIFLPGVRERFAAVAEGLARV